MTNSAAHNEFMAAIEAEKQALRDTPLTAQDFENARQHINAWRAADDQIPTWESMTPDAQRIKAASLKKYRAEHSATECEDTVFSTGEQPTAEEQAEYEAYVAYSMSEEGHAEWVEAHSQPMPIDRDMLAARMEHWRNNPPQSMSGVEVEPWRGW